MELTKKLVKLFFDQEQWEGSKVLKFNTTGSFVGSFGLDKYIEINKVGNTCRCEGTPQRLQFFKVIDS
jgi:hypothetical protein